MFSPRPFEYFLSACTWSCSPISDLLIRPSAVHFHLYCAAYSLLLSFVPNTRKALLRSYWSHSGTYFIYLYSSSNICSLCCECRRYENIFQELYNNDMFSVLFRDDPFASKVHYIDPLCRHVFMLTCKVANSVTNKSERERIIKCHIWNVG